MGSKLTYVSFAMMNLEGGFKARCLYCNFSKWSAKECNQKEL